MPDVKSWPDWFKALIAAAGLVLPVAYMVWRADAKADAGLQNGARHEIRIEDHDLRIRSLEEDRASATGETRQWRKDVSRRLDELLNAVKDR